MSKVVLPTLLVLAIASAQAQADTQNSNRFYAGIGASLLNLKTGITAPEDDDFNDGFNFTYAYKERLNLKNGIFQLGYQFSESFSVEGQYSSSMQSKPELEISTEVDLTAAAKSALDNNTSQSSAQIADVKSIKLNLKAAIDCSVTTTALYAVYKTPGNFYAKFKGGPVSISISKKPRAQATFVKDLAPTTTAVIKDYLTSAEESFNDSYQKGFSDTSGGEQSERDTKLALGVGAGYKINQHIAVEAEYVKMGKDVSTISLSANYYF